MDEIDGQGLGTLGMAQEPMIITSTKQTVSPSDLKIDLEEKISGADMEEEVMKLDLAQFYGTNMDDDVPHEEIEHHSHKAADACNEDEKQQQLKEGRTDDKEGLLQKNKGDGKELDQSERKETPKAKELSEEEGTDEKRRLLQSEKDDNDEEGAMEMSVIEKPPTQDEATSSL